MWFSVDIYIPVAVPGLRVRPVLPSATQQSFKPFWVSLEGNLHIMPHVGALSGPRPQEVTLAVGALANQLTLELTWTGQVCGSVLRSACWERGAGRAGVGAGRGKRRVTGWSWPHFPFTAAPSVAIHLRLAFTTFVHNASFPVRMKHYLHYTITH